MTNPLERIAQKLEILCNNERQLPDVNASRRAIVYGDIAKAIREALAETEKAQYTPTRYRMTRAEVAERGGEEFANSMSFKDSTPPQQEQGLVDVLRAHRLERAIDSYHNRIFVTAQGIKEQEALIEVAADTITKLTTALEDIALARIPGVPDGATILSEQFATFAVSRARAALGMDEG